MRAVTFQAQEGKNQRKDMEGHLVALHLTRVKDVHPEGPGKVKFAHGDHKKSVVEVIMFGRWSPRVANQKSIFTLGTYIYFMSMNHLLTKLLVSSNPCSFTDSTLQF